MNDSVFGHYRSIPDGKLTLSSTCGSLKLSSYLEPCYSYYVFWLENPIGNKLEWFWVNRLRQGIKFHNFRLHICALLRSAQFELLSQLLSSFGRWGVAEQLWHHQSIEPYGIILPSCRELICISYRLKAFNDFFVRIWSGSYRFRFRSSLNFFVYLLPFRSLFCYKLDQEYFRSLGASQVKKPNITMFGDLEFIMVYCRNFSFRLSLTAQKSFMISDNACNSPYSKSNVRGTRVILFWNIVRGQ